MGSDLPKQFLPVKGKPLLMHTLERFYRWDPAAEIILVIPEDQEEYWDMLCREIDCIVPHRIAPGGETRFHSVKNGLELTTHPSLIAVHDGVRPFVSDAVISRCFDVASSHGAAIPVLPVVESLRRITPEGSAAVNREEYVSVQTPQVFRSEIIYEAYQQGYSLHFTDDASVVEAAGFPVKLVQGNPENIKITTPQDLAVAQFLLSKH